MRKILVTELVWELNLVDGLGQPFIGLDLPRLDNARLLVMKGEFCSNEAELKIRFKVTDTSIPDGKKDETEDVRKMQTLGNKLGYAYRWASFSRWENRHEFDFLLLRANGEDSCTTICRGARRITEALGIDMRKWPECVRYPDIAQRTFWARSSEEPGCFWLSQGRLAAQNVI